MSIKKSALKTLDLMTTTDVAKALGVTVRSVQLWVEQGALEGWKTPGGHRRITRASFNKFNSNVAPAELKVTTRLNVVVVEDSLAMQKLYQMTIASWQLPIDIKFVSNGCEGIIYVTQHMPDLLITDLKMPEMDGFAMLKSLRDVDIFAKMAIVVVTGMQPQEIEEKGGLPRGVRLYGKSPVPFWEMRELMQGLIDRKLEA
ncbi:response regulator [Methylotenera sp.]|jgi:excisionase family DNA binding protein|uniref:response regulator n=1 Tax=Methylotenera sp. TaxID=2051956 RepID=UPI0027330EBD|nr:response regulator [Methylotenera sp.]MDP3211798.1 response regulator [Methylotenera sp.]MDP3776627.1 response regulator [Methylotenera sp.]